jgi:hypothetical protein
LSLDDEYFRRFRPHEQQVLGCDLLDACVCRPGALLDLQLAPFDIQFIALVGE